MRIPIRLGGHSMPWRFRDGDRLGDWIASRPWHSRTEVRLVRLAQEGVVGLVFDAIQQAVVGADLGTSEVQCIRLNPQLVVERGFEIALARRLGVTMDGDRYTRIQAVARRLADRPRLCLVPPLADERPKAAQDAEECVDLLGKVEPGARACVLLADTRARPLAGVAFDLAIGAPAAEVGSSAEPLDLVWSRYLHVRLAYEAAGDPGLAEEMIGVIGRVAPEDDVGLERGFNRYAEAKWAKLDKDIRRQVEDWLNEDGRRRAGVTVEWIATLHRLAVRGLYWQVGSPYEFLPAPWLARGLLQQAPKRHRVELLRGCLTCAPLAQDLLTVCLQLEARERGRLFVLEEDVGSEAKEHWDRFQQGASMTYRLYPAGSPAAPAGPWAFASFGQLLRHVRGDPHRDALYRLLELRNHLAHGHYVGWNAVTELIDIRRRLSVGIG